MANNEAQIRITADGQQAVTESARVAGAVKSMGDQAGTAAPQVAALGDAVEKTGERGNQAQKGVAGLFTGIKALAGAAVVKEFIDVNASLESIEKTLEGVTGSSATAKAEMAFVTSEANRLGIGVEGAAGSFVTLAAATKGTNLEGQATRDIWSAVAGKMAEMGASTADVNGAMTQLAQGASKGKFELEDLKSIAERIPGFFGTFAQALGVTNERFFEMVSAGEITADMLPKLAGALGGTGGEIDTFNANLARMKNALMGAAVAIGDTGIFDALSTAVRKTGESIGFLTASAHLIGAAWNGSDAEAAKALETYEQSGRKLFGIKDAADAAAQGLDGMAGASDNAAVRIADAVGAKIVSAFVKLDGTIKDTDAAFKKLGVDPGEITTGIGRAEREIVESFKRLAADPNVNGQVLMAALVASLDKVSKEAVPEIGFAYKVAAKAGKQSADEMGAGLDALKTKAAGLWSELDKNAKQAGELEAAYKRLGITSQDALKKTADQHREDYELLVKNKAPIEDQARAWKVVMDAAVKAGDTTAQAMLASKAAVYGYSVEVDAAGKTAVKAMGEAAVATASTGDAARGAGQHYAYLADEATRAWEASERQLLAARAADAADREQRRTAGGSASWEQIFGPGFNMLSGEQQQAYIYQYQSQIQPKIEQGVGQSMFTNPTDWNKYAPLVSLKKEIADLAAAASADILAKSRPQAQAPAQISLNVSAAHGLSSLDAERLARELQPYLDKLLRMKS